MSCVNKVEVQFQDVFDKIQELTNGHSNNALLVYLNLVNRKIDLSKHIVTAKDLEIVKGKKINFQAQYSIESLNKGTKLSEDEKNYITKEGKKLKRVSSISEDVAPLKFKTSRDTAIHNISSQNEGNFNENMSYEVRKTKTNGSYEVVRAISFNDYVEELEVGRDKPRQEGKIKHKYLESLLSPSLTAERELNDLISLYKVSSDLLSKWKQEITDKVFPFFEKFNPKNISSEVLLTMAEAGVAGTVDILHSLGDGLYSIYDLKTGKLNNSKGAFMKYVDRSRFPIVSNSLNKNKLSTMMYAVMLKYNKPDARFQDIQIIDNEGKLIDVEILPFLFIIGEYFRDTNPTFYSNNKHLFDASNYVASTAALQDARKKKNYKDSLLKSLYKSLLHQVKGIDSKEDESLIEMTRLVLEDLSGFDMFKSGHKIVTGFFERGFANIKNISDPILQQFSILILKGDQAVREEMNEITKEYNKRMQPVLTKIKKHRNLYGSNYKTEWNFAWDEGKMTTYKSEKWETLSKSEQNFMDYHRWMIRFSLFSTMHPKGGIKYIMSELTNRENLKQKDIDFLKLQILKLQSLDSLNKFKLDKKFVTYYEGWSPRVHKTSEEYDNTGEYLKESAKQMFKLTEIDEIRLQENNSFSALPIRGLGKKGNEQIQKEGEYSFNAELVFSHFVASAVRKKHLDHAMALGMGIKAYIQEKSKGLKKDHGMDRSIMWLDSIIKAVLYQEVEDQGPDVIKVLGQEYSTKKTAMTLRNYVSTVAMGLNIPGMVKNFIGMTWVNNANALSGSLAMLWGAKNVDMTFKTITQAKKDYIEMETMYAQGKIEESKLHALSKLLGYSIDSYNYDRFNTDVLKSIKGKWLPEWANYDAIFLGYRMGDRYNNHVNLAAQLRSKMIGGKSMWDHYKMINGELTYTGPVRGVTSDGNIVKGLTSMEMSTLKHKSEQLFGSYRAEERMPVQNGAITGAFMQFKAFWPALIRRAYSLPKTTVGVVEMMNTNEYMVVDPKHPDYGKKFIKNSDEFKAYEKEDVRILPVLTETFHSEEGYLNSMAIGLRYAILRIRNPEGVDLESYNLSDYQKKNIAYGLATIATHLALMGTLAIMFGAKGSDDELYKNNVIIQSIRKSPNELLGILQLFIDRNSADSLTSVPVVSKTAKFVAGMFTVVKDLGTGKRIETGKYEGNFHGQRDVESLLPYAPIKKFYESLTELLTMNED